MRYFYHPESDSLFTESDPVKADEALSNGLTVELTQSEYETASKFRFTDQTAINHPA